MRIRTLGTINEHPITARWYKNSEYMYPVSHVYCTYDPEYSFISDEQPRFKRYGGCLHRCTTRILGDTDYSYQKGSDKYVVVNGTIGNSHGWFNTAADVTDTHFDWDSFNAEAYLGMKPTLSSSLSMSNFLAELTEIKTMFKLFSRAKTLTQNAAGAHLNYSFGWKPFISDLRELYERLTTFKAALAKYKSQQGQILTSHYQVKYPSSKHYWKHPGWWPLKSDENWTNHVATASMTYHYKIPMIDAMYADIKGLCDVLGLKLTPSVIWNGIPFSFVGDWFFNIGDVLSKYDTDYLESVVTILDYCCSLKLNVERRVYVNGPLEDGSRTYDLSEVGTETETYYRRKRCLPNASDFGLRQSHRYGTKQVVLSVALCIA